MAAVPCPSVPEIGVFAADRVPDASAGHKTLGGPRGARPVRRRSSLIGSSNLSFSVFGVFSPPSMPKGTSSASSATRKKHARKQAAKAVDAGSDGERPPTSAPGAVKKLQRGQKKEKRDKKQPKKKVYVPPPRPPPGATDPVDLYGLGTAGASPLPPEIIVTLRLLMKKAENTLARAVEDLASWAQDAIRTEDGRQQVLIAIPVWAAHFPRLTAHGSRRLRVLAASLQSFFATRDSETRIEIVAPSLIEQAEYLGAWCASAFDTDRAVRSTARRSWDDVLDVRPSGDTDPQSIPLTSHFDTIVSYLHHVILPPADATERDTLPVGGDDSDEDSEGRRARLTAGALDAIAYLSKLPHPESDAFEHLLQSVELWSKVHPGSGDLPLVRRALWSLWYGLVQQPDLILMLDEVVPLLAKALLRAAFAETDPGVQNVSMPGLVRFLQEHPEAWLLADAKEEDLDDSSSSSASDTHHAMQNESAEVLPTISDHATLSPVLREFQAFLQLGCRGNPVACYPAVLLLLSTLPAPALLPVRGTADLLLSSFWAAYDGHVLDAYHERAYESFFTSISECSLLLAARIRKSDGDPIGSAFLTEQYDRVWRELIGLGTLSRAFSQTTIESAIEQMCSGCAQYPEATARVLRAIEEAALELANTGSADPHFSRLANVFCAFNEHFHDPAQSSQLLTTVSDRMIDLLVETPSAAHRVAYFEGLLQKAETRGALFAGAFSSRLDQYVTEHLAQAAIDANTLSFLLLYVERRGDLATTKSIWISTTAQIGRQEKPFTSPYMTALLSSAHKGALPSDLPDAGLSEKLAARISALLFENQVIADDEVAVLAAVLVTKEPFIGSVASDSMIETLATTLTSNLESALPLASMSPNIVVSLRLMLQIVQQAGVRQAKPLSESIASALAASYLISTLAQSSEAKMLGAALWKEVFAQSSEAAIRRQALRRLAGLLVTANSDIAVSDIVMALDGLDLPIDTVLDAVLPSELYLCDLLGQAGLGAPPCQMCIFDPLVQYRENRSNVGPQNATFVRTVLAGVMMLSNQRARARDKMWFLPYIMQVSLLVESELAVPGSASAALGNLTLDESQPVHLACKALFVSMLTQATSGLDSTWHEKTASSMTSRSGLDPLATVLANVHSESFPATWRLRIFCRLLSGIMRQTDAGAVEAEYWLSTAQRSQKTDPLFSLAILGGVRDCLYTSPRFQRFQSELASALSGVSSAEAVVRGTLLLKLLLGCAPPADTNDSLLPQQRALFLLQALQKWFASDDDLNDETHALLSQLFVELAPVMQDREGKHWDFMFDVVESNLETASWSDPTSLPGFYHALRFILTIQDLADTNGQLRSWTQTRLRASRQLTVNAVLNARSPVPHATPATAILHLGLAIMTMSPITKDLPSEQMGALLDLLAYDDAHVRQRTFSLALSVVEYQVKELVVEAELETDDPPAIILPLGLTGMLRLSTDRVGDLRPSISFLLSWLLVFEHFKHSSFRLKAAYLDQLRRDDLVERELLPPLLALVDVGDRGFPFDPSPWSIDDVDPSMLDDTALCLPLLASHVYLRTLQSVPSLVRAWWERQRNKQFHTAISTFTSKHFSPVLIAREMAQVDAGDLANDELAIKISATGAEVRAVYTVDETPMELSMRMPPEYPLVGVVVNDSRSKVGVAESQWRAWVLAVQQVVMTQNGLISDALALFKRNVSLHFEGVEACAICYSIISVVDRTLPTKRCRTCKNLFHAGCLYKWFRTSSGSTCPLCRSIF